MRLAGFADGAYDVAEFCEPNGLCFATDSNAMLCIEAQNNRVRRLSLSDGLVSTYAGSGRGECTNGSCQTAAVYYPRAICADPINSGCYWIADRTSIRYCDGKTVSLIVGHSSAGNADGVGEAARRGCVVWRV